MTIEATGITCQKRPGHLWVGRFEVMKSPCEIWLETTDQSLAHQLITNAVKEATRIEQKYSRFLSNSIVSRINHQTGQWQTVDKETFSLLQFASECWEVTDGLIDITIGGYLKHWKFDGRSAPPSNRVLQRASHHVGWQKVNLDIDKQSVRLPQGMLLDFGGIVKEYAVDLIANMLTTQLNEGGIMVNFGGDLNAIRAHSSQPWLIGIENVAKCDQHIKTLSLTQGAIATSGSHRHYAIDRKGRMLGHILHPKTGRPVKNGPSSVTVIATTATQCGILSTCAMLKGSQASNFLKDQAVQHFIQ